MNTNNKPKWINELPLIVKESKCRSEVLTKLGLTTNGSGNHRIVKRWIEILNIDTSHFNYRQVVAEKLKKIGFIKRYKDSDFLVKNWLGSNSPIKRWATENLEYKCELCNNIGFHNNLPLKLQLDHKNGNDKDNRKENLRWLCPNCHTQTPTFGSKKLNLHRKTPSEINPNWRNCDHLKARKVLRPTKETLETELLKFPMTSLGKKYGVSDKSIKKWCQRYGINTTHKRGFWKPSK